MKIYLMIALSSCSLLLLLRCTPEEPINSEAVDEFCVPKLCSITYYPSNPSASISNCGLLTFSYEHEYYTLCFDAGHTIEEYLGWSPLGSDIYYTDFWSFDLRDNCIHFQTNDDLIDEVIEDGFLLDVEICDNLISDYTSS